MFRKPPRIKKLGGKVLRVDSQAAGYEGHRAIDGDPASLWHSAWEPAVLEHPHQIVIDLGRPTRIAGFTYLPRQDMANGRIADWEFYVSGEEEGRGEREYKGRFPEGAQRQTVRLDKPATGRFIRLVALSEVNGGPWTSVAELDILEDD
jgi:endo-alpha-N-acetylgalactosaminidase